MATNKKEKKMLEDARTQAALRWTQEVLPDIPPPSWEDLPTEGFMMNASGNWVSVAWSKANSHGRGTLESTRIASQNAIPLYSTKVRALQAMRHELEQKYASSLRAIDKQIEQAEELMRKNPNKKS